MLARFATGASFSTDCKGGGRESNSRFLPFMIQMASHLVDGSANQQRHVMAKAVTSYLSSSPSTPESPVRLSALSGARGGSGSSEETVQFMMVNSLLSESYESWLQHRPAFLQRGIYHAYMQHKHGRSTLKLSADTSSSAVRSDEGSSADSNDSKRLFAIVQPMLVYTGLIEQLQQFFKKGKSSGTQKVGEKDGSSGGNLEAWEIMMKEKLGNMKEMLGFSKDVLSWLEDMTSSEDLQEAFDVMGALPDVFSGGHTTCEDFVRAIIHGAKS